MKKSVVLVAFLVSAFAHAQVPFAENIYFQRACERGDQYVISAVGDVLLHSPLQKKAAAAGDFTVLWDRFNPYFESVDMAYANLEGPTAAGVARGGRAVRDPGHIFDNHVYTSYPMFNYHPSLITDLARSGFDILSTSNNHSLDRGSLGADLTIDALEAERHYLSFAGTRKVGEDERDRPWLTVVERNGLRIGWLACTYGTNGLPDKRDQVLHCFKNSHRQRINQIIRDNKSYLDAIIVTPHWGSEYQHRPARNQQEFAKEVLDSGATAVIGAHPHVLQPMTKYLTRDGRETFIIYSLGNFVSNQSQLPRRSTLVLFLGLTKTRRGVHVNGVKYLPAVMTGRGSAKRLLPTVEGRSGDQAQRHIFGLFSSAHALSYSSRPNKVLTNDHCF